MLDFHNCDLPGGLDLTRGHLRGVFLLESRVHSLIAPGTDFDDGIYARDTRFDDTIQVPDARLGGQLSLKGCTLNGSETALAGRGLDIRGLLYLGGPGSTVNGKVVLDAARIGGTLDFRGGRFLNPSGTALTFINADVGGDVMLSDGFRSEGALALRGARVRGQVSGAGGEFSCAQGGPERPAFGADEAQIEGSLRLSGARIQGVVRLAGVRVDGNLEMSGASIENEGETALLADRITVGGSVHLADGFKANGEVRFPTAEVNRSVYCQRGTFLSAVTPGAPTRPALGFERATIHDSVFLRDGFTPHGVISFAHAEVRGVLELSGISSPGKMILDLTAARVGMLVDDESSWPPKGALCIRDFVYASCSHIHKRIKWLQRWGPCHVSTEMSVDLFPADAFEHLASLLWKRGYHNEAWRVLAQKERDWRQRAKPGLVARCRNWFSGLLFDHWYRPHLAAIRLGPLFLLIGWLVFASQAGGFVPTADNHGVAFEPFWYALDTFLPGSNIGHAASWVPVSSNGFLAGYRLLHSLFGAAWAFLLVTGITGLTGWRPSS